MFVANKISSALLAVIVLNLPVVSFAENSGTMGWANAHLKHKDFVLEAGRKSPAYPELVRANRDGSCDFRLRQPGSDTSADGYYHTRARPNQQIKEGDSDFYGFLLVCDYTTQRATIRDFDLSTVKSK